MLFAAGDDEAACATLVSGALKVSAIDREGTEQILSLVHPSGFIGELFTPFAHHDVVALTESRLCTFARRDIERAIEDYPALARALLRRSQADLLATRNVWAAPEIQALLYVARTPTLRCAIEASVTTSTSTSDPKTKF